MSIRITWNFEIHPSRAAQFFYIQYRRLKQLFAGVKRYKKKPIGKSKICAPPYLQLHNKGYSLIKRKATVKTCLEGDTEQQQQGTSSS
jgi:hypothetical protein